MTKITALTENTDPQPSDLAVLEDDPSGTPDTQKITLQNLIEVVANLTAIATGYASSDELLVVDGGVAKKSTIANFLAGLEDALSELATRPDQTDTFLVVDAGVAKYVTKRNMQVRHTNVRLFAYDVSCAVGDKAGGWHLHIPPDLNGLDLVYVHAEVDTAGTTGTMDIQIHNVTQAADMLTTKVTIDTGETGSDTAATAYVIDTANDDVATNDLIRVDIDAVHSGTAALGLTVTLGFA